MPEIIPTADSPLPAHPTGIPSAPGFASNTALPGRRAQAVVARQIGGLGAAGQHFRAEAVYSGIAHNMQVMDSIAFWPQVPALPTDQQQGEHHG